MTRLDVLTMADVLTEAHLRRDGHCGESHRDEAAFVIERYVSREGEDLDNLRRTFEDEHFMESWYDEEGVEACHTCGVGWPCAAQEYVAALQRTEVPA